jgi:hypothetical protein
MLKQNTQRRVGASSQKLKTKLTKPKTNTKKTTTKPSISSSYSPISSSYSPIQTTTTALFSSSQQQNNKQAKVDPRLEKQRKRDEEKRQKELGNSNSGPNANNIIDLAQDSDEKKKDEKERVVKTWLQIYSDMELKNIAGPLAKKAANNTDRRKFRLEQMKDFLASSELIEKIVPKYKDHSQQVWCRKYGTKEPPQLVTFGQAIEMAKLDGEFTMVTMVRSASQSPQIPSNIKGVIEDGIVPVWLMNVRNFMEELYEKDASQGKAHGSKEIQLNTTITPDDLKRKVQNAIDFLFEGNTVRLVCTSKSIAKLSSWVESNTYFDKDEIVDQTKQAIETGRTVELSSFIKNTKATFQREAAEQNIKAKIQQNSGETDQDFQKRVNTLVEQEKTQFESRQLQQQNQQKQQQQLIDTRISQNMERLMGVQKTFGMLLQSAKQQATKTVKEVAQNKDHPQHRDIKGLKPGQYLPTDQKKVNLINKQLDAIDSELTQWRERSIKAKKGQPVTLKVTPYQRFISPEGVPLSEQQSKSAQKAAMAEMGAETFGSGGGSGSPGGAGLSELFPGGGSGPADVGDGGEDGEDEEGQQDHGEDDDNANEARPSGKLTKKEMEEKKVKMALEKMNAKERVAYLANVISKQSFSVIGDVVEILGKVSTIMMQERAERKKNKISLDHDEIDPEAYAKLSNKDKKRYDAKMTAIRADPNAGLKLELQNAMELFNAGRYVYNDAILDQQMKKPFWCTHDGGASPQEAARKNTLTLNITKSALKM